MNVRRRVPPVGVIAVLLLLALASIGVAFGLWSKVLTVEGTVQTGSVHAKWSGAICSEFHPWPFGFDITPGEAEGKDVGSTTVAPDPSDDNNLFLTVENGYPSYAVDCQVEFVNDGSIPWKIRGIGIVPGPDLTNCTVTGSQTVTLSCDQVTVIYVDGVGAQFEPGDIAASSLRLHVEQEADQNASYQLDVRVCVAQWDEPATLAECEAAAPQH
jgi:hypothetical protein